jgi:hypothetical protein
MKKNNALLLGLAAVAAYFIFFKKPGGGSAAVNIASALSAAVDQLPETPDYKSYFKSQIPNMSPAEQQSLLDFISGGRVTANATVTNIYMKYQLGT